MQNITPPYKLETEDDENKKKQNGMLPPIMSPAGQTQPSTEITPPLLPEAAPEDASEVPTKEIPNDPASPEELVISPLSDPITPLAEQEKQAEEATKGHTKADEADEWESHLEAEHPDGNRSERRIIEALRDDVALQDSLLNNVKELFFPDGSEYEANPLKNLTLDDDWYKTDKSKAFDEGLIGDKDGDVILDRDKFFSRDRLTASLTNLLNGVGIDAPIQTTEDVAQMRAIQAVADSYKEDITNKLTEAGMLPEKGDEGSPKVQEAGFDEDNFWIMKATLRQTVLGNIIDDVSKFTRIDVNDPRFSKALEALAKHTDLPDTENFVSRAIRAAHKHLPTYIATRGFDKVVDIATEAYNNFMDLDPEDWQQDAPKDGRAAGSLEITPELIDALEASDIKPNWFEYLAASRSKEEFVQRMEKARVMQKEAELLDTVSFSKRLIYGFAPEVLGDPTTYITMGVGTLAKRAAVMAGSSLLNDLTIEASTEGGLVRDKLINMFAAVGLGEAFGQTAKHIAGAINKADIRYNAHKAWAAGETTTNHALSPLRPPKGQDWMPNPDEKGGVILSNGVILSPNNPQNPLTFRLLQDIEGVIEAYRAEKVSFEGEQGALSKAVTDAEEALQKAIKSGKPKKIEAAKMKLKAAKQSAQHMSGEFGGDAKLAEALDSLTHNAGLGDNFAPVVKHLPDGRTSVTVPRPYQSIDPPAGVTKGAKAVELSPEAKRWLESGTTKVEVPTQPKGADKLTKAEDVSPMQDAPPVREGDDTLMRLGDEPIPKAEDDGKWAYEGLDVEQDRYIPLPRSIQDIAVTAFKSSDPLTRQLAGHLVRPAQGTRTAARTHFVAEDILARLTQLDRVSINNIVEALNGVYGGSFWGVTKGGRGSRLTLNREFIEKFSYMETDKMTKQELQLAKVLGDLMERKAGEFSNVGQFGITTAPNVLNTNRNPRTHFPVVYSKQLKMAVQQRLGGKVSDLEDAIIENLYEQFNINHRGIQDELWKAKQPELDALEKQFIEERSAAIQKDAEKIAAAEDRVAKANEGVARTNEKLTENAKKATEKSQMAANKEAEAEAAKLSREAVDAEVVRRKEEATKAVDEITTTINDAEKALVDLKAAASDAKKAYDAAKASEEGSKGRATSSDKAKKAQEAAKQEVSKANSEVHAKEQELAKAKDDLETADIEKMVADEAVDTARAAQAKLESVEAKHAEFHKSTNLKEIRGEANKLRKLKSQAEARKAAIPEEKRRLANNVTIASEKHLAKKKALEELKRSGSATKAEIAKAENAVVAEFKAWEAASTKLKALSTELRKLTTSLKGIDDRIAAAVKRSRSTRPPTSKRPTKEELKAAKGATDSATKAAEAAKAKRDALRSKVDNDIPNDIEAAKKRVEEAKAKLEEATKANSEALSGANKLRQEADEAAAAVKKAEDDLKSLKDKRTEAKRLTKEKEIRKGIDEGKFKVDPVYRKVEDIFPELRKFFENDPDLWNSLNAHDVSETALADFRKKQFLRLVDEEIRGTAKGISHDGHRVAEQSLSDLETSDVINTKFTAKRTLFDHGYKHKPASGSTPDFSLNDLRNFDIESILGVYLKTLNGRTAIQGATGRTLEQVVADIGKMPTPHDKEVLTDILKIIMGKSRVQDPMSASRMSWSSLNDLVLFVKGGRMGETQLGESAGGITRNIMQLMRTMTGNLANVFDPRYRFSGKALEDLKLMHMGVEMEKHLRPNLEGYTEMLREQGYGAIASKVIGKTKGATRWLAHNSPFTRLLRYTTEGMVSLSRADTFNTLVRDAFSKGKGIRKADLKLAGITDNQYEGILNMLRENVTTGKFKTFEVNSEALKGDPRMLDLWRLSEYIANDSVMRTGRVGQQYTKQPSGLMSTLLFFKSFMIKGLNSRFMKAINEMGQGKAIDVALRSIVSVGVGGLIYAAQQHARAVSLPEHRQQDYLDRALSPEAIVMGAFTRSELFGSATGMASMFAFVVSGEDMFNYNKTTASTSDLWRESAMDAEAPTADKMAAEGFRRARNVVPAIDVLANTASAFNALANLPTSEFGHDRDSNVGALFDGVKNGLLPNSPLIQAWLQIGAEKVGYAER